VIALVTDSNAQLPEGLRERFGVRVVPLTIVLDGEERLEGVNLEPDEFYDRLARGAPVTTAAPSPGRFAEVYTDAAAAGATEILSIHIGSNISATVGAAHIAEDMSPVPVEIVDTGTASFPIACCVWAAGASIERGEGPDAAAAAARAVASTIGNVFIVGALDLARRSGRLASDVAAEGVPVLALDQGAMDVVGRAHDLDGAVDAMVAYFEEFAGGRAMRVGVGHARAQPIADALDARLRARPDVESLVRYQVGPSVGAHTGAGTAGAVFFPDELVRS
jgi:DegV family protein with EDD domain